MANSALKGKTFPVPNQIVVNINSALASYSSGGDTKGLKKAKELVNSKRVSYEQMKKLKTFFDNYNNDNKQEYKLSGGDPMKVFVDKALKQLRDGVDNVKRSRMNAGEENQYKKTHTKDNDNANPTGVNMPKVHKGSMYDQIMNNKVRYESYDAEIESVRYLIEYMDNNKNKII